MDRFALSQPRAAGDSTARVAVRGQENTVQPSLEDRPGWRHMRGPVL